jgi:hypothetical protein
VCADCITDTPDTPDTTPMTPEQIAELAEKVALGVAFLEVERPDWRSVVDPDILDVSDGSVCVTAQLSGKCDWVSGMRQLGLDMDRYDALGFRIPENYPNGTGTDTFIYSPVKRLAYAELNRLWKEALASDPIA